MSRRPRILAKAVASLKGAATEAYVWSRRNQKPRQLHEPVAAEIEGTLGTAVDATLLIGTLSGLMIYEQGEVYRLIEGKVYGIAPHGGRWYAFVQQVLIPPRGRTEIKRGHIVSFRLEGTTLLDLRIEESLLHPEVHQIDVFGDTLYVTDTMNNRLVLYRIDADGRLRMTRETFPNGYPEGLNPPYYPDNYAHLNSVIVDEEGLWLVYHNQTKRTGRTSQLARLNSDLKPIEVIDTDARCAHNIVPTPEGPYYCNSLNGELRQGERVITQFPCYVRGLAITEAYFFVGGSQYAERGDRSETTGSVFVCDRNTGEIVQTIALPGSGSVYEVRAVEPADFALSATPPLSIPASS